MSWHRLETSGLKSVRENHSFAPSGLVLLPLSSHGSRRGLHSGAASRLKAETLFHQGTRNLVLTHTLKPFHDASQ